MSEVVGFPSARHDDQVDALAQLLDWSGKRDYDSGVMIGGKLIEGDTGDMPWLYT